MTVAGGIPMDTVHNRKSSSISVVGAGSFTNVRYAATASGTDSLFTRPVVPTVQ